MAGITPPGARRFHRLRGSGSGAAKTSRIELRASEDDRNLLDRAAAALGVDRSSFLLSRPARSLPGLVRLLERPSPFVTPAADQAEA